jgi:hypothetical protein
MLRRPPEPVWMALVAAMAVLNLVQRDGLGLAVCLSFLTAGILARPTWRLPLRTLFVLAASSQAVLCAQNHRLALLALYAVITLYGITELHQDARTVLHQRTAASG